MDYYLPIPLITHILHDLQWCYFAHSVFSRRIPRAAAWGIEATMCILNVVLGSVLPYMSLIRFIYNPIMYTLGFAIVFRDGWKRTGCFSVVMYLATYVTEIIIGVFLYTPEVLAGYLNEQPLLLQLQIYICWNIINSLIMWSMFLFVKRGDFHLSRKEWLPCVAFMLCQISIIFGSVRSICLNPTANGTAIFAFTLLTCVAMDALLIKLVLSLSQKEQLQLRNRQLAGQIDAQLLHYTQITAEYEAVRQMRHDITKHLTAMEQMLRADNHRDAVEYITQLKENSYRTRPRICRNPAVDALLSGYLDRARSQRTRLSLQVQVPDDPGIENADLICAFGNLLDNALEACSALPDPEIRVICAPAKEHLVITVRNPFPEVDAEKPRHVAQLERGLGSRILQHIAEKYQGDYTAAAEGQYFLARLTLRIREDAL